MPRSNLFRFAVANAVNFELAATEQTSSVVDGEKLFGYHVFCLHNECAHIIFDMRLEASEQTFCLFVHSVSIMLPGSADQLVGPTKGGAILCYGHDACGECIIRLTLCSQCTLVKFYYVKCKYLRFVLHRKIKFFYFKSCAKPISLHNNFLKLKFIISPSHNVK